METTLREQRVTLINRILAKIKYERNEQTVANLARKWKMERSEVKSSFHFRQYHLFDYRMIINCMKDGKSFDEIYITFEQAVFCEQSSLLSFSFHVYDDDLQLVKNFDNFNNETNDRANEIIKNFLIQDMGIKE